MERSERRDSSGSKRRPTPVPRSVPGPGFGSSAGARTPQRQTGGPIIASEGVTFRFADDSPTLTSVSLVQEVAWPREGPELVKAPDGLWEAGFSRPPVDRMEYRFELKHSDGATTLVLDPANPMTAPGAFGERSVIEFPEYQAPSWVEKHLAPEAAGSLVEVALSSASLGYELPGLLWSPPSARPEDALPLLVVLDGVEFAQFSQLPAMLDVLSSLGELPRMRALLLHPVKRDEEYTANQAFAEALADGLLIELAKSVAVPAAAKARAGLGASLGGLALMHAHTQEPELFGGLFLQSSSFLHGKVLPAGPLERITRFVDDLLARSLRATPIPVTMTCGTVEKNLTNNREIVAVLCEQGYPAELQVVRDAHNWIGWRDAWTPLLPALLRRLWG